MLVISLLAATAAAFAYAQRAKLEDSPIQNTRLDRLISPVCVACDPRARQAPIAFRLKSEDHVTVDLADREGQVVREALFSGRYSPRFLQFSWDGRDSGGRVVADGLYRVRVRLEDDQRTLEFPNEIRVDATPPTIDSVEVRPRVISPDGDRRSDRASVSYRFSEAAYAVLYVDGKRRPGSSFRKRPAGVLQWYGRGLRPGTHRLALAAQDPAGNLSPSTREFEVRVRYVELARRRYVVRPGVRFNVRVSTDATSLTYRLGGLRVTLNGERPVRRIRVVAPRRPGRYVLAVDVGQRRARALVVVRGARR